MSNRSPQWAKAHDLLLEAYSPLGGDGKVGDTLNVPEVKEIAAALGMTPAQVIISWHLQRGVRRILSLLPSRFRLEFMRIDGRPAEERHAFAHRGEPARCGDDSDCVSSY